MLSFHFLLPPHTQTCCTDNLSCMNCGWKLIQRPGSNYFLGFSLSEISLWCLFCFVFFSLPLNPKRVSLSCLQGHRVNLISLHSLGMMSLAFKQWLGGVLCAWGALCKTGRSFHSSVSQQHSAVLSVKRESQSQPACHCSWTVRGQNFIHLLFCQLPLTVWEPESCWWWPPMSPSIPSHAFPLKKKQNIIGFYLSV